MSDSNENFPASAAATPSSKNIWSASFQSLLWTNWLTAINDNVFRWFVIGVGKDFVGPEHHSNILMLGTIFFVLPYILLASPAGWLADRFSKRNVIVGCKILEIVVMTLGIISLLCQSLVMLMATIFFMGAQSALFAPAKIGKIPELLDEKEISAGNGIFNLATLSATVIGMAIGGWLADVTGDKGQEQVWLTALVLVGIATIGTLISFRIKTLPAANKDVKFPYTIIGGTIRDIKALVTSGALFRVAIGIIFFWSIAGVFQLNVDVFADESGSFTESHRTPLLISLVLGVGLGSVLAGLASGNRISLGLVPWGALGISLFCVLLYFSPAEFINEHPYNLKKLFACLLLAGLGISAGFFDVPLAAYLQHRSPIESRGAILSANNCLIFTGIMMLSLLFGAMRTPTYEGAKSNLPADQQISSLSAGEQQNVAGIVAEFQSAWDTAKSQIDGETKFADVDKPIIEDYFARLSDDASTAGLAELVWVETKAMRDLKREVSFDNYSKRFPGRELQVKDVIKQASYLPLFTSRQIFLLMGLMTIPVIGYFAYKHRQL